MFKNNFVLVDVNIKDCVTCSSVAWGVVLRSYCNTYWEFPKSVLTLSASPQSSHLIPCEEPRRASGSQHRWHIAHIDKLKCSPS